MKNNSPAKLMGAISKLVKKALKEASKPKASPAKVINIKGGVKMGKKKTTNTKPAKKAVNKNKKK